MKKGSEHHAQLPEASDISAAMETGLVGSVMRRHVEQEARRRAVLQTIDPLGAALRRLEPMRSVLAKLEDSNRLQQHLAFVASGGHPGSALDRWKAVYEGLPGAGKLGTLGQSFSALATVKAALGAASHVGALPNHLWLTPLKERNSILRLALQSPTFPDLAGIQAYAKMVKGRDLSIQDHLQGLSEPLASFMGILADTEDVEEGELTGEIAPATASSGIRIGDRAAAIYIEDDRPLDQQWWASRPPIERLNTIIAVMSLLVALASSFMTQGFTNEQAKATTDSLASITDALTKMAAAEQLLPHDQRHDALITAGLAEYENRMAGRPCQVLAATSVRGQGPNGAISSLIQPGQLALCTDHQGKWIEVIYDDGQFEVSGWALKKHFRLSGSSGRFQRER